MNIIEIANEVLDIEANSILNLKKNINNDFINAVDILYNCKGRVIVTGIGKSGHIGKKISATLSSTGTPSYFLHPAESIHGDSGMITKQDVIIAISNSGETAEILQLLPLIKRFGVKMIALTSKESSTLAKTSDVFINVGVEREACPLNKAPTASTSAALAMGDALSICLLKKRGFTENDFLTFHPGGKLGKGILYKVSDLMITGDKLPIISENTNFIDIIKFISDKKLGMAILVDDNSVMSGILTDGDIRRTLIMTNDIKNLKTKDVMTKNPKTILSSDFAAKAIHLMETYSITTLAIVDENKKPVGVIHIHDLLKAGVA